MADNRCLLIAGGDTDPQLLRLLKRAALRGVTVQSLLTGQSGSPRLHWDIKQNRLLDHGEEVRADAAFIRQDVFAYLKSGDPQDSVVAREWFASVSGWLMANPEIHLFNRPFLACGAVNKPYVLRLALEAGFEVADTCISNDVAAMDSLCEQASWISKPVTGGSYCTPLQASGGQGNGSGLLAYPQIVQRRLESPELRIFRVGDEWFAFRVISEALDYRASDETRLERTDPPSDLVERMAWLSDQLGLGFAAADFKTDPSRGKLQFLEINTNPMFAGFDQVARGAISDAMLRHWGLWK